MANTPSGNVTPTREGQGPASPALANALMPDMLDPANSVGNELLMVRNYLAQLAGRHNKFVGDVNQEFFNTAQAFVKIQNYTLEVDRKLGVVEKTFSGHDQRIVSNDVWLKSVCQEMTDQVAAMFKKGDELTAQVRKECDNMARIIHEGVSQDDLDKTAEAFETRVQGIEQALAHGLKDEVRANVVENSERGAGPPYGRAGGRGHGSGFRTTVRAHRVLGAQRRRGHE